MSADEVEGFIAGLPAPQRETMAALCAVIRGSDARLTESIAWGAPSFSLDDHLFTTGIDRRSGRVRLVLHSGARSTLAMRGRIDDATGMLEWKSDDRAVLHLADAAGVEAAQPALTALLREWVAAVGKGPAPEAGVEQGGASGDPA
ncbi:DUF1801 domain-containing protein [Microcella daejeonensis]|uniref:DUF1801 domain-containing protein n=1 Tax=Microcella daejeonensis TaxID=2994971 RepID=A0A9E8MMB1_9MICO|nr:DUF1801 domain-containing protein [Microcella daejeonensis]WAB82275.1 DUF1801 domain-containing protein [Microcella daejeonensis]